MDPQCCTLEMNTIFVTAHLLAIKAELTAILADPILSNVELKQVHFSKYTTAYAIK